MKSRFIYEIAENVKEAMSAAAAGFGYETKSAAEEALADPKIDSYYRNRLKVIRLKTIEE